MPQPVALFPSLYPQPVSETFSLGEGQDKMAVSLFSSALVVPEGKVKFTVIHGNNVNVVHLSADDLLKLAYKCETFAQGFKEV